MNHHKMHRPTPDAGSFRRARGILSRAVLCCAAAFMLGLGQPTKKPAPFTPVDPGVVDLTSNAVSMRVLRLDQRIPTGFDQVYKVDPSAAPKSLSVKPLFARKSGALTVLFPRGEYAATEEGAVVPVIPPGARMIIGDEDEPIDPRATARSLSAVDRSVSTSAHRGATVAARSTAIDPTSPGSEHLDPTSGRTAPSMLTDEGYRVRRIRELLKRAAAIGLG